MGQKLLEHQKGLIVYEPPWYKSPSNWALILVFALLMILASWILVTLNVNPDLRGDLLDPPFPREERGVSWYG